MISLLIAARQRESPSAYAARLLEDMDLPPDLAFHPGYTLRVQALGRFVVHRGQEAVANGEWHREKARHLFQLLLTNRDRFLRRDEIAALLWPEANAAAAEGQFKVTLNALQGVLEPQRPPRAPTLFVQRRGSAYGLYPAAPLWVDATALERVIAQENKAKDEDTALELNREALALYQGDFLIRCVYEDWCREERERLRRLYLTTATRTAAMLLARGDADEGIRLCRQALAVDDCLEAAYQLLIRAYLQQGDRVQALRTYERCETCLRQELDVAPAQETKALIGQIRESSAR